MLSSSNSQSQGTINYIWCARLSRASREWVAYCLHNILAKKLLKAKPAELDKFDIADSAKLVGSVALAMWTRDMLIKQGYLKPDIGKL